MMDDLTATRLCAEAMGLEHRVVDNSYVECKPPPLDARWWLTYYPLHDDAQAMALVKRFRINICWYEVNMPGGFEPTVYMWDRKPEELNREVVYCVAKMQAAKVAAIRDGGHDEI